ncbi:hypothetical protein RQP53_12785 [Paucibacter sp. APW11]|uniref:C-type lysozyme inhibitor domain-containing protein n=1 Tax=Roseateles aquae TaxID=3077235 RepID=A0ABU3PC62_9BURK|nr:hypothetical protein [Paucibacter sp. APW11]MDT9000145.1 hypothetical protein [Paucibacter sp. APW11]
MQWTQLLITVKSFRSRPCRGGPMLISSRYTTRRTIGLALTLAAALSGHGLAQARVAEPESLSCRSAGMTRILAKASAGDYQLDNGQTLKLKAQGCQLLASLDDRPEVLLHEYKAGQWRSQDGRIDLSVDAGHGSFVSGVKLGLAKLSR